jgi:hypothetical protein
MRSTTRLSSSRHGLRVIVGSVTTVLSVVLGLASCAPHAPIPPWSAVHLPPDSILTSRTEAVPSSAVRVGEAEGVVVDAYSGRPLLATVYVKTDNVSERPLIEIATAEGYFHLAHLPHRPVVARVHIVGYYPDTVLLGGQSGYMIRFGLHAMRMRACGLPILTDSAAIDSAARRRPADAISVSVRDARTGSVPVSPVTIRVRDGAYSDSATSTSANMWGGAVVIGVAPERRGVYDVDVTATGYEPWHLRRVQPILDGCGSVVERTIPVWLLPI